MYVAMEIVRILAGIYWCVTAVRFMLEGAWAFGAMMLLMIVLLEYKERRT